MSDLNLDIFDSRGFLGGDCSKEPTCQYSRHMRWGVQSLAWEDPLEEGMATLSSPLAWRIAWTEEPGGLQSMGSQRVGYDWSNLACVHIFDYNVKYTFNNSDLLLQCKKDQAVCDSAKKAIWAVILAMKSKETEIIVSWSNEYMLLEEYEIQAVLGGQIGFRPGAGRGRWRHIQCINKNQECWLQQRFMVFSWRLPRSWTKLRVKDQMHTDIHSLIEFLLRVLKDLKRMSKIILSWPINLFGFHVQCYRKLQQTFWPTQYLNFSLVAICSVLPGSLSLREQ